MSMGAVEDQGKASDGEARPARSLAPWLLGLTAFAFLIRVAGLDRESLWNDELFTAGMAQFDSARQVIGTCRSDNHPPLYFLLLWAWTRLVGDSETMLRLPSVFFGTLCVPAMFALGRRLFDRETGVLAAVFAAISFLPWDFSREARQYPLLQLLCVCLGYFLYGLCRSASACSKAKTGDLAGFALSAILLSYTHYYGLILSALAVIALIILALMRRSGVGSSVFVGAAVSIAYAPWLSTALRVAGNKGHWIKRPTLHDVDQFVGVLYNAFIGLQALLVALAVTAVIRHRRVKPRRAPYAESFLGLWIAVPFAVIFVKSLVSIPIFYFKYMTIVVPAAHGLLARMCALLAGSFARRMALALTLSVAAFGSDLWFSGQFRRPTRDQFREAVEFVLRSKGDAPLVAFEWDARNFGYYVRRFRSKREIVRRPGSLAETPDAEAIAGGRAQFWLMDGDFVLPEDAYRTIDARFDVRVRKEFRGIRVTLYSRRGPPEGSARRG